MMAQYTGYYQPWMRKTQRVIVFIASCVTLSIGFYDLYKNFPLFSTFVNAYFHSWSDWFEEQLVLRMTMLKIYIIYFSGPFAGLFQMLFISESTWLLLGQIFYPFVYIISCIKSTVALFYDMFLPLFAFISLFLKTLWTATTTTLFLPFTFVRYLFGFVYNAGLLSLDAFHQLTTALKSLINIIRPVTQADNREAALSMFQIVT